MIRNLHLLMLSLLIGGASPLEQARPDSALISKGDLGIATYAMLFVIVSLIISQIFERRSAERRVRDFVAANDKLAAAIDRMTERNSDRTTVELVHNARVESIMGRIDAHLARVERNA